MVLLSSTSSQTGQYASSAKLGEPVDGSEVIGELVDGSEVIGGLVG